MPHIFIIEDDPAIATTLRFSLEREGYQTTWVDTVSKVSSTLAQLATLDAIILDVGLPDGNGFDVCQTIRNGQYHAQTPIVFLTARDDEIDTILALELGADDYITKPFSPREVIARLKAIWRRQQFGTPSANDNDFYKITNCGTWQYRQADYCLMLNNQPISLSKTELAIMLALLQNPTHILSREHILSQISDHPEHRLARTIDSHIKTLRQKFTHLSTQEIIITHRGLGYSLC